MKQLKIKSGFELVDRSGQKVIVYKGSEKISFSVKTEVEFFELTEDEIEEYIKTSESFDKAGSYGIQGKGALLVKRINGDYFNVVGLPVSELNRKLKEFLNGCH